MESFILKPTGKPTMTYHRAKGRDYNHVRDYILSGLDTLGNKPGITCKVKHSYRPIIHRVKTCQLSEEQLDKLYDFIHKELNSDIPNEQDIIEVLKQDSSILEQAYKDTMRDTLRRRMALAAPRKNHTPGWKPYVPTSKKELAYSMQAGIVYLDPKLGIPTE